MAAFPYIHIPTVEGPGPFDIGPFHVGPLDLQAFGLLVATGIVFGIWMAGKYSYRNGLDEDAARYLGIRLIIWGFLSCHVLNTFFYEWDRFVENKWILLNPFDGISSWGGIIGGGLALYIYTGVKKLDRQRWGDWAAYGAIAGWVPGRLACAVTHDHVGYPTRFFLGVDFPPGAYPWAKASKEIIRAHDLGLEELVLVVLPIFVAILLLERWKGRKPGFLLGFLGVTYSLPRFFLDFLRHPESDPRYAGLTFAQYACIAGLLGGVWLLARKRPAEPTPVAVAAPAVKPSDRKKAMKKRR